MARGTGGGFSSRCYGMNVFQIERPSRTRVADTDHGGGGTVSFGCLLS